MEQVSCWEPCGSPHAPPCPPGVWRLGQWTGRGPGPSRERRGECPLVIREAGGAAGPGSPSGLSARAPHGAGGSPTTPVSRRPEAFVLCSARSTPGTPPCWGDSHFPQVSPKPSLPGASPVSPPPMAGGSNMEDSRTEEMEETTAPSLPGGTLWACVGVYVGVWHGPHWEDAWAGEIAQWAERPHRGWGSCVCVSDST